MKPADFVVRCMARREGDLYVAVCIDLTLAAQGKTFEEARDKLHAQIRDYVKQALTVDRKHAAALLTRKGPLADRLRFRWCELKASIAPKLKKFLYRETLPVRLAAA